jgi:hypothetical protein
MDFEVGGPNRLVLVPVIFNNDRLTHLEPQPDLCIAARISVHFHDGSAERISVFSLNAAAQLGLPKGSNTFDPAADGTLQAIPEHRDMPFLTFLKG